MRCTNACSDRLSLSGSVLLVAGAPASIASVPLSRLDKHEGANSGSRPGGGAARMPGPGGNPAVPGNRRTWLPVSRGSHGVTVPSWPSLRPAAAVPAGAPITMLGNFETFSNVSGFPFALSLRAHSLTEHASAPRCAQPPPHRISQSDQSYATFSMFPSAAFEPVSSAPGCRGAGSPIATLAQVSASMPPVAPAVPRSLAPFSIPSTSTLHNPIAIPIPFHHAAPAIQELEFPGNVRWTAHGYPVAAMGTELKAPATSISNSNRRPPESTVTGSHMPPFASLSHGSAAVAFIRASQDQGQLYDDADYYDDVGEYDGGHDEDTDWHGATGDDASVCLMALAGTVVFKLNASDRTELRSETPSLTAVTSADFESNRVHAFDSTIKGIAHAGISTLYR